jgi:hypothetical protein
LQVIEAARLKDIDSDPKFLGALLLNSSSNMLGSRQSGFSCQRAGQEGLLLADVESQPVRIKTNSPNA